MICIYRFTCALAVGVKPGESRARSGKFLSLYDSGGRYSGKIRDYRDSACVRHLKTKRFDLLSVSDAHSGGDLQKTR